MYNGFDRIDKIVCNATKFIAPRAEKWAKMYKDEKLIYTMGSGSAHSVAYSFAICLLMEMQWINSSAIHSGEYFHGPFEITDRETPFIVFMSEGRTRPLDQRALDFLKQYAEKLMIVDVKELGINTIDDKVVEFFNPLLLVHAIRVFAQKLSEERKHPLTEMCIRDSFQEALRTSLLPLSKGYWALPEPNGQDRQSFHPSSTASLLPRWTQRSLPA